MTITRRTVPDLRTEFMPESGHAHWGSCIGAIDASVLIPSGATVEFIKGRRGFGIPMTAGREKRK